jgi:GTP-binding protein HflX
VLKERLIEVKQQREIQRASRKGAFKASLVGYTNAGKSSVLRQMSGSSDVFVEDRLFATLDPLTREVDLGDHQKLLLTDTVGFIRKHPHHLVASFRATLEEVKDADLLLHVIDASHPTWEEQRLVVDEVLADLGVHDTPVVHVFNKIDALEPAQVEGLKERMAALLPGSVFVSCYDAGGLEPLREMLLAAVRARRPAVQLRIPAAMGKVLAEIHRSGEVVSSAHDEETGDVLMTARVDSALFGRLERDGLVAGAGARAGTTPTDA